MRNAWHVIAQADELPVKAASTTSLCGSVVRLRHAADGTFSASAAGLGSLPVVERFGYIWTSLGEPPGRPMDIPELDEPDRRMVLAGGFGVHTSAPRAVENFLDLAHLPFVHAGTLGSESCADIASYDVRMSPEDGVLATRCRVFQPRSALSASDGFTVEYVYRVREPFCAILLKANPIVRERMDVIGLFVQPLDEERIIAYLFASVLDDVSTDEEIRAFNQTIFAQDKPILENQRPRKLPLDLRAELPIRADSLSVAYRRWLKALDVSYGTIS